MGALGNHYLSPYFATGEKKKRKSRKLYHVLELCYFLPLNLWAIEIKSECYSWYREKECNIISVTVWKSPYHLALLSALPAPGMETHTHARIDLRGRGQSFLTCSPNSWRSLSLWTGFHWAAEVTTIWHNWTWKPGRKIWQARWCSASGSGSFC